MIRVAFVVGDCPPATAPLFFHDAFRRAEREGCDAVVPLGTLDLGVDSGRSVVDIPLVAPLQ